MQSSPARGPSAGPAAASVEAARARGAPHAPGSADPDRSLLAGMAAGDESALAALYDRWSPQVYSLALRVLGDATDAEEVVEDTFWQAWRQCSRHDASRGSVCMWLLTIGRSRALDRLRSRGRGVARGGVGADEHAAEAPGPLGEAEAAEVGSIVRGALSELPAEQRTAIELAYFGGLSQTEIAERTGEPLGTVKTRVRLAMQKLRQKLSVLREEPT